MLIERIVEALRATGRHWSLKGRGTVEPGRDDVEAVLEEAVKQLTSEPLGTRLEVGGLIIEKRPVGYEIYVYTGWYE